MLFNNNSEMFKKINKIVPNVVSIRPIGNHELKRHLVYFVKTSNRELVIKFYYVNNRWNRDVAALRLLQGTSVQLPKLIEFGKFEDVEWLLYEYKEGILLNQIADKISKNELKNIYEEAGEQLALIHSFREFNYYGGLDEELNFIIKFKTFKEYFNTEIKRVFNNLDEFVHEEKNLIDCAKKALLNQLNILDSNIKKPRLCHNDFSSRNIIVNKYDGEYHFNCIIDFEQSVVSDVDRELLFVYKRLCKNNKLLIEAFKKGYERHMKIDEDSIMLKDRLYELYRGLSICGWSQKVDLEHYNDGINILKKYIR